MRFEEFKIGQKFEVQITITSEESDMYMFFSKTRNVLLESRELAEKEGITEAFLSGRSILSRAEGEMTRLDAFYNSIMMLYGMDGDPNWNHRQCRFLSEVHPGEELSIKYIISNKSEIHERDYGILAIDLEIRRVKDQKLVVVSRRNLYTMKK